MGLGYGFLGFGEERMQEQEQDNSADAKAHT